MKKLLLIFAILLLISAPAFAVIPITRRNVSTTRLLDTLLRDRIGTLDTQVAALLSGGGLGTGTDYYVNSAVGADTYDGKTWTTAKATLEGAFNISALTAGDNIHMAQGHATTLDNGTSDAVDMDVAGVTVIGYGNGSNRPTITYDTTTDEISFDADNIVLYNLRFLAGVSAVTTAFDVKDGADDCAIIGCEFPEPTTSGFEFVRAVTITTADRFNFSYNVYRNADATGGTNVLDLDGGVVNGVYFIGNDIIGEFAEGVIHSDDVDLEVVVGDNDITNMTTGQHAIEFTAAATGIYYNNRVYTDGYWTSIDPGSLKCTAPNWVVTEINESPQMFPRGETDRQFLEILMSREIGAVAGSAEEIKVWWVDGGAGSTGDGKSPEGAFDTIEEALTECSDTIDDWILVQDYSGSTNEITIANSFVHIIGYGSPGMRYPRIQASTSGEAGFVLGDAADYVEIAYFIIASTGSAAGIEFNGSGGSYAVWIHHNIFGRSGNTVQDGIAIMPGGAAPHLLVEYNRFGQGAVSAVTRDGVRFGGNASWSIVRHNVFRSVDGIGINYNASVSQPMAHDNHFQLVADGVGDAIDASSGTSGGYFFNNTATFGNGAATEEVFRDQGTGNEWSGNIGGSVPGSTSCVKTYLDWSAAEHSLFDVKGGPVKVTSWVGLVVATIKNTTMNMALDFNPTSPGSAVVLATNLDIDNDAIGTSYTANATFGGALIATTNGGLEFVGDPFIAPIGTMTFTSSAVEDGSGSISWYIEYEPLAPGAYIVPATTD